MGLDNLLEHLEFRTGKMSSKLKNRLATKWRKDLNGLDAEKELTKKLRMRAGVNSSIALSILGALVFGGYVTHHHFNSMNYHARQAAQAPQLQEGLEPLRERTLKRFTKDIEEDLSPLLSEGDRVFYLGSYPKSTNKPVYVLGTNKFSKYFLEGLITAWEMSGDEYFMERYADFASHQKIDVQNPVNDFNHESPGRFFPGIRILPHLDTLHRRLDEQTYSTIANNARQAILAASITARQYDPGTQTFNAVGYQGPKSVKVAKEHNTIPLLILAARSGAISWILKPTHEDPLTTLRVPRPNEYTVERLEDIVEFNQEIKRPITATSFVDSIMDSGVTSINLLLDETGKSYFQGIMNAKGEIERKMYGGNPEDDSLREDAPISSLGHVTLMRGMAERILFAEELQSERLVLNGLLRKELGENYLPYLDALERKKVFFVEAFERAHNYLITSKTMQESPYEATAELLHINILGLHNNPVERERLWRNFLGNANFNDKALGEFDVGLVLNARGLDTSMSLGTYAEADALFLSLLKK